MLDCPLSRHRRAGAHKDLVVYASGDAQAIKRLRPVFADFSRQAHDLGAFGNGSKMKYVANLLVAIHNVASAEAMVLGMKAGLDPQLIFDLIQCRRRQFARVRAARADDGGGPLRRRQSHDEISIWQKDMEVIGDFAEKLGCRRRCSPRPSRSTTRRCKSGYGDEDTAAVCAVLEKMANLAKQPR